MQIKYIPNPLFYKDKQGKYLGCNNAFEKFTGKTEAEIMGKTVQEIWQTDLAEEYHKKDIELLNNSDVFQSYEFQAIDANNNIRNVIFSKAVFFDEKNQPAGIVGIYVDTTELLKTKEELIIAKEKAEESDRLKTEFINNMSHEIRTPLNGILGFSKLLNKTDKSEEKRKHYINIIQNSGKQLMRIIDDILEISALGTKQVKVIKKEIYLNEMLLELFSIFDIKAKEKKIPLYLKNGLPDNESLIETDATKLNKILSNLLENALKFTQNGFIELGYTLEQNITNPFYQNIQLYVKDTGIGIKPESQQLIFDRFSQAEKEISKSIGGLGLGLSIAKENTELLEGKIMIKSEKGKGSTFFVSIPCKKIISEKNNNSKEKCTILIAEDEEVNYLFLETLIIEEIKLDCKLLHAKNGQEAIDICNKNIDIDIILMDLKMNLKNGLEATKTIKKSRANLPIIAQTAYSSNEDKEKALAAGCDDFISKPISEEVLKEILHKYLLNKE
ncbi:MAG: response regulator [Bacteroidales bacterium]|nr:response regulator [Bacteroidales bacterium]